jgi:NAD(P)-dependent dehydrogenase (short-subunit alcohol dehydrogenase family)
MSRALENRTAIITGANQGLGRAIARAYVEAGANLLICARNADLLAEAQAELSAAASPGQTILMETADVSQRDDVERLAARAIEAFGQVHILVNNAGVYGPKGGIAEIDWDEWMQAIQINLFGSVLLCRALLPHFKQHGYGKIVQLSGGGATNPLPFLSAYAASKAAVIRFAETLAEEMREYHIDVNAIAPGALNTRLLDEVLEAGPEKVGQLFYDRMVMQKAKGGTPLEKGAALAVYLASAESDGITGKLISAVWDPWETLADHHDDLRGDVYSLRRIVPQDRGFEWGER